MKFKNIYISIVFLLLFPTIHGQEFYFGNDLSYVNQMEDCGAVFKENNVEKDVYEIFSDHGTNLVRVRLWVDPSWWQAPLVQPTGTKSFYNDLEDVKETIRRAKEKDMQVMLGIHYSDFWADPGRQLIPRMWLDVAYDQDAMKDTVYSYTYRLLDELNNEGLMPEFVKVGNENNSGILKHVPEENGYEIAATVSNNWSRHAVMYNAAIRAIRDISAITEMKPKIALHFSGNLSAHNWSFQNLISKGVSDFDIMGISYYYSWHGGSLKELESTIKSLKQSFPQYEVMVAETGYLWSTQNFDPLGNIINTPDPDYLPVSPAKQLEYLVDFTRAVKRGGGIGMIFWEPAWVSTPCRTPWGVGSSHDHVVFFDPENTNFMENGGGMWMQAPYYEDLSTWKVSFKVDMSEEDVSQGVFITGSFSGEPWELIPMTSEGGSIYSYYTYLPPDSEGGFYFLNGPEWQMKESIPTDCMLYQDSCRRYFLSGDAKVYSVSWSSCSSQAPDSVQVTFAVDMTGEDISRGVFLTGDQTGSPWSIIPLSELKDSIYYWTTYLRPEDAGAYYYMTTDTWDNYKEFREEVPTECAEWWTSDRGYSIADHDTIIAVRWGSCETIDLNTIEKYTELLSEFEVFPNPFNSKLMLVFPTQTKIFEINIINIDGSLVFSKLISGTLSEINLDLDKLPDGPYLLAAKTEKKIFNRIVIKQNL